MREPSIHITISKLQELLGKHFPVSVKELNKVTKAIATEARRYAIDTRSIQTLTQKVEKAVSSRTKSNFGDANLLADIIYSARVKLKHIGVTKIKQSDPQWAQVKQLVPTANEFCERYALDYREGYIQFVTTGLKLLSKSKKPNYNFCASWMNQRVDYILSMYEAEHLMDNDEHLQYSQEVCNIYTEEILARTGISERYTQDPLQFVNFIKARELADELGVDYETFIMAQFAALDFCKGIPRPEDLHSDKAKTRVIAYMSKHNIVAEAKTSTKTDWSKFKR